MNITLKENEVDSMKTKYALIYMLLLIIFSKGMLLLIGVTDSGDNRTESKSFDVFLSKFTSDMAFQYAHIKFPIGKLDLLDPEADAQGLIETKEVPFTKELWVLKSKRNFPKGDYKNTEDGFKWVNDRKVIWSYSWVEEEVGCSSYSESFTFEYIDGDWYVTQGYYENGIDTPTYEEQVEMVRQSNSSF